MTTPAPTARALHKEVFDCVAARDFGRLREISHPDYTYTDTDGVEHEGIDAGIAVAETYTTAFPDLRFEVLRHWVPDETASIMEMRVQGTHQAELEGVPASGRQVSVVYCNVIEVREGKVYRERDYFDGLSLMKQLGASP